jgi:DNA repair protein RadD
MSSRQYQQDGKLAIYKEWDAGNKNVLYVLPTGGGKTYVMSEIVLEHNAAACLIAHRQELVTQISLALARMGIRHRIIGPKNVVKLAVNIHMAEVGRSYYDPSAKVAVAGVDTLIRREAELKQWLLSVTLWLMDESHHPLVDNKWGKAIEMFPNAKGLGVTATPIRADGKGLGRHADGNFDVMVEGPTMRALIGMGFLTDYRIFAPPSDLDLSNVNISTATGDYNKDGLRKAVRKSHIMGDVVKHYLQIAGGKLGITFATDVETATDIAAQFNAAGVPAEVVSANTPDADRIAVLRRFKKRELLQLVNVDLFGEGFDLPAIEVVSMARPTQSYSLYAQQFGRALRPFYKAGYSLDTEELRKLAIWESIKPNAIIIDHVGNVLRHGLPDARRTWSLDRREKRSRQAPSDVIPVKACPQCTGVYERIYPECPFCGFKPVPTVRSGPAHVDGDLCELDAETLAAMRGAVAEIDKDAEQYRSELMAKRVPQIGQLAHVKRHVERQDAQRQLREAIAWWAGYQRAAGRPDSESYRRFYFKFNGIDVLSAQALGTKEAVELTSLINAHLEEIGKC